MKLKIMMVAIISMQMIAANAQTAFWAKGFASGFCDFSTTDNSGNIYATGVFSETLTIDDEVIVAENPYNSWLGKFSSAGELLWLVNITSTGTVQVRDIIMNNEGNIVIVGNSFGMVNFGPLLMGNESDNYIRGFIAVYDQAGTCIGLNGTNGETDCFYYDVAVDENGNYSIAGQANGSFAFGAELVNNYGGNDAIYGMYDNNLDGLWMKSIGGPGTDGAFTVAFDSNGEIILGGIFDGDFMLADVPFTSYGGQDIFLIKTDTDGFFHWYRTMGSEQEEYQTWMEIALDENDYIYFAANMQAEIYHQGGHNTSYGGTDAFITRYNSSGGFDWFLHGGGTDSDQMIGMTKGNNNNFYMYGYFLGAAEFDGLQLYADEASDGFFVEVGSDGFANLVAQTDGDDVEAITSISIDNNNNLIMAGYMSWTISFEGAGTIESLDPDFTIFLAKLETDYSIPEVAIEDITAENMQIILFPNPAVDFVTLDPSAALDITAILILNTAGQVVKQIETTNSEQLTVSVSDLPAGIYQISMRTRTGALVPANTLSIIK